MAATTTTTATAITDMGDALELEDIVRMSPSPTPQMQMQNEEMDVEGMRRKVMGITDATEREKELVEMVMRLTETVVDPGQLVRQAEVITALVAQRDFVVRQGEEERGRFEAEREGWERMGEALVALRGRGRDEDWEKKYTVAESDNRALRDKLQETQTRLNELENEILALKPILLVLQTQPQPQQNLYTATKPTEQDDHTPNPYTYLYPYFRPAYNPPYSPPRSQKPTTPLPSSSKPKHTPTQTSPTPTPTTITTKSRSKPPTTSASASTRRTHHHTSFLPLTSDARTEHLLLAARKLGRERTTLVSGLFKHAEREKARMDLEQEQEHVRALKETERVERERAERVAGGGGGSYYRSAASTAVVTTPGSTSVQHPPPRTPKRAAAGHYITGPSPFFIVGSPGGYGLLGTPRQSVEGSQSNPPTPLDSLLSAAQRMMDDSGRGRGAAAAAAAANANANNSNSNSNSNASASANINGNGNRKRGNVPDLVEPESPVPKRRRVGVKSALDVLADQAAAEADTNTSRGRRGKGKAKEEEGGKAKGRRVKEKETKEKETKEKEIKEKKVKEKEAKEKEKEKEVKEKKGKTKAQPVPVRKTTRPRAPPRDRSAVATAREKRRAKEGSVPRMISPPVARVIAPPPGRTSPVDVEMEGEPMQVEADEVKMDVVEVVEVVESVIAPERGDDVDALPVVDVSILDAPEPEPGEADMMPVVDPLTQNPTTGAEDGETDALPVVDPSTRNTTPVLDLSTRKSTPVAEDGSPALPLVDPPIDSTLVAEDGSPALPLVDPPIDSTLVAEDGSPALPLADPTIDSTPVASAPVLEPEPAPDADADADADAEADPDPDADADAEDDDQDAEGEKDDEPDVDDRPPSSRTPPPPPAPPPPGGAQPPHDFGEDDNDDDHDADADAEGEIESDLEGSEVKGDGNALAVCVLTADVAAAAAATTTKLEPPIELVFANGHRDAQSVTYAEDHDHTGLLSSNMDTDLLLSLPPSSSELSGVAGEVNQEPQWVRGQQFQIVHPGKRVRSPYVKWSKEEDDLLAQAVAKFGQKWDKVQQALPSRGYHQVRQRWLRKLGVFNSAFQTARVAAAAGPGETLYIGNPPPNLKLGMAPLSSEVAYTGTLLDTSFVLGCRPES